MLSRVAEALFWVGRYVERAEDTARLLDVHFHEVLEDPGVHEAHACAVLLAVMGVPGDTAERHRDSRAVLELLGYDEDASSSIVGALSAAWENARSAREALSAEIWECLNSTYNSLQTRVAAARDFGPAPFFSYVRERAASVAGYVEASMSRDASYDALVLGRSLERVDMTARMLAARLSAGRGSEGWTSTLRACSAHDAYLRTYQQGVEAPRVVEFLLVDRLFPRSVFYALRAGEGALARLDPASGRSGLDEPARRAIGRARTDLEFLSAANLLDGLPDRLLGLQRAVSTISEEVTQRLFAGSPPPQWSSKETRGMSWRIAIRHRTGYKYAEPVRASYNEARLTPPSVDGQHTLQATLVVTPAARPFPYVDYWGTKVHAFDIHVPHTELVVLATSTVETAPPRPVPAGISWSELAGPAVQDRFAELLTASPFVTAEPELTEFGRSLRAESTPMQAGQRVAEWTHETLRYEPGATHVYTSSAEARAAGKGVCQDFAHVTLALLRAVGLPARYVSGYLHPAAEAGIGETTDGREPCLGGILGR